MKSVGFEDDGGGGNQVGRGLGVQRAATVVAFTTVRKKDVRPLRIRKQGSVRVGVDEWARDEV